MTAFKERSSIANPFKSLEVGNADLPAQITILQLIIMAVEFRFAMRQRKNAHYRNDPIKYGLEFDSVALF